MIGFVALEAAVLIVSFARHAQLQKAPAAAEPAPVRP